MHMHKQSMAFPECSTVLCCTYIIAKLCFLASTISMRDTLACSWPSIRSNWTDVLIGMEQPHRPYDNRRYAHCIVAIWCFPESCHLLYWGNTGISVLTYQLRLCCSVSGEIYPRSQNQSPHQRNKTCETQFMLDRTLLAWQETRAPAVYVVRSVGCFFFPFVFHSMSFSLECELKCE